MGNTSRWDSGAWTNYSAKTRTQTQEQIFKAKSMQKDLDPKGVKIRESRDSAINPNSNAIIVAVDVTGSMGVIAEYLVKTGLGVFFKEVLERKPVSDPHLMVMAVGDAVYDSSPIQVSQFECDITIAKWLEQIYIEHGGGGNGSESYHFPLYFAANHTSIDCVEKRNKKGYLFTIGDEGVPPALTRDQILRFIGDEVHTDLTYPDLLAMAEKMYDVYHIIIGQGYYASRFGSEVKSEWRQALGERAVWLDDYTKLSELMVSLIMLNEGTDRDAIVKSWDGSTSMTIANSIGKLSANKDIDKFVADNKAVLF